MVEHPWNDQLNDHFAELPIQIFVQIAFYSGLNWLYITNDPGLPSRSLG